MECGATLNVDTSTSKGQPVMLGGMPILQTYKTLLLCGASGLKDLALTVARSWV